MRTSPLLEIPFRIVKYPMGRRSRQQMTAWDECESTSDQVEPGKLKSYVASSVSFEARVVCGVVVVVSVKQLLIES